MTYPKAYEPQQGYKYQILVKTPYDRAYEHCDYAKDNEEKNHLIKEYQMAYGAGHYFKSILLPKKYWNQ
ncbi:hypothetical protein [Priestia megaterium]|uniref:hypothetical protein n=1 Tax=Priestia megaterium TaxID=1404 RepID=UPI000BFE8649|nr:hypothetical protein [Priestia megaterium]PGO60678.1 hypothetical protein CN981_09005 [Priestia megaterium]